MNIVLLLACSVLLHIHLISACMEELLRRTDASEYGYTRFNGPASWSRKFESCAGDTQSPVVLNACEYVEMTSLVFHGHADYRHDGFRLHNTFQSVEVEYSGHAPLLWGGPLNGNFSLVQVHFHWGAAGKSGSEHVISGALHIMEAHLVHMNTKYKDTQFASQQKDGLVVVAVLFKASTKEVAEMSSLTSQLQHVEKGGSYVLMDGGAMTWLQEVLDVDSSYFTYRGSLTTPPCSQTVTWIVLSATAHIGFRQLRSFRSLRGHDGPLRTNRRPLQLLNNRQVTCSAA